MPDIYCLRQQISVRGGRLPLAFGFLGFEVCRDFLSYCRAEFTDSALYPFGIEEKISGNFRVEVVPVLECFFRIPAFQNIP